MSCKTSSHGDSKASRALYSLDVYTLDVLEFNLMVECHQVDQTEGACNFFFQIHTHKTITNPYNITNWFLTRILGACVALSYKCTGIRSSTPLVSLESRKVHLERIRSCLRASLAKCYGCVFAKIKTPGSDQGSPGVLGRMSLVRMWAERGCILGQPLWVKNTWHLFFPRQGNPRTLLHHLKGNWFWRSRISLLLLLRLAWNI